jgi:hypothetical protein
MFETTNLRAHRSMHFVETMNSRTHRSMHFVETTKLVSTKKNTITVYGRTNLNLNLNFGV